MGLTPRARECLARPLSRFTHTPGPFDVVSSYDRAAFEVSLIEHGV